MPGPTKTIDTKPPEAALEIRGAIPQSWRSGGPLAELAVGDDGATQMQPCA